jgi:hypothetical protein
LSLKAIYVSGYLMLAGSVFLFLMVAWGIAS